MSLEDYAVLRATPGSVADVAAASIMADRKSAQKARLEFGAALGGRGYWGNDRVVTGLIFPDDKPLPRGWRRSHATDDGVVAVPDRKTKEGKNVAIALRGVPSLPCVDRFTELIGGHCKIVDLRLRWCFFERIGETLFVMCPFFPPNDREGNPDESAKADQFFTPEGCERVPLSVYYAAKEAAEAEKAKLGVPV